MCTHKDPFGAALDALVAVIQGYPRPRRTNTVLILWPYPYPVIFTALKTALRMSEGTTTLPPFLRR
jgi:hypothetical protein